MQINESMDLEKKIKQFEKDYHNGPANEGLTQLWKSKRVPDLRLYYCAFWQLFLYSSSIIPKGCVLLL